MAASGGDMNRPGQRMMRFVIAIASVLTAWWLFDFAGDWSRGSYSVAQFLCFLFCVLGIQRIASASADRAVIAFSERRTPRGT